MKTSIISAGICAILSTTCLAESFQLRNDKSGNLYGPYEFKDGATVIIGKASFTLVKSEPAPSALEKKMDEIVIPWLGFREANISSVLQYFREVSEGVNFILKGNPQDVPPVTLDLSSVSLSDAVKFVSEMAGLEYSYYNDVSVVLEAKK